MHRIKSLPLVENLKNQLLKRGVHPPFKPIGFKKIYMRKRSPCQSHGESHPSFVEAWMEKSLGGLCGNTLCAPQIQKLPSGACDGRIRNVESGGVWGGSGWRSCFLLGCLPQNAGDLHPRNTNMKPRNEGFKTMMFPFKGVIFRFYLSFLGSTHFKKKYIIAWLQQPPHATQGMQRSEAAFSSHFQTDGGRLYNHFDDRLSGPPRGSASKDLHPRDEGFLCKGSPWRNGDKKVNL